MPKHDAMTENELAAYVRRKVNASMNREDGDISDVRENLFSQYYGAKYGDEREGKSGFVTREVLEAVEWAKPSLVRMFFSGDRVVAFEPVGPEDEETAQQETDVINYAVRRANGGDGFVAFHDFITDTLLNPTAYLKVWMEEKETSQVHDAEELTAEQLQPLVEDKNIELLEQNARMIQVEVPEQPEQPMQQMQGQPTGEYPKWGHTGPPQPQQPMPQQPTMVDVEVFDLKYRETKVEKRMRIMGVPPEEVLVDPELTSLNLDDATFVCHRSRQAYTTLVNMGYDKDMLDKVGAPQEDVTWNEERVNRLFYEDESPSHNNEFDAGSDDAMRQFWVYECYAWVDFDGDGLAEYRRIVLIGDEIFENEETNYQPLVAMSSILVPHKHNGLSIAQLVQDLQALLTELTRQLLDNVYSINTRRRFVGEDALLEDGRTAMLMQNPAAVMIPVRGRPSEAVFPDPTLPIISDILPVIQDMRQATSMRTGIAPENSVDPGVLQQSTYGAFMGAMEKANERIELIARIMAETGIKTVYRKAHQLHRMHPDIAKMVRLRNKWVKVDPRGWRDRTDVKVNVGLGFANKQQMLTATMQALELQQQVQPMGLADVQSFYNNLAKFVEYSGLGAPEFLFKDPSADGWQPPQPQPSPEEILAMAQAEVLKADAETKRMKVDSDSQLAAAQMQLEQQKLEMESQQQMIDGEVKLQELAIKEQERRSRDLGNRMENLKTIAEVDNVEQDSELKEAQAVKALADAEKSAADAARPDPKPSTGGKG